MISLKKYLDSSTIEPQPGGRERTRAGAGGKDRDRVQKSLIEAYQSALRDMGACSVDACPALGQVLCGSLNNLADSLHGDATFDKFDATQTAVHHQLEDWGRHTAAHYREKTVEVKALLMVMARAAGSVAERDQRCAGQISEVTTRLAKIASLEDLTEIRSSIERSAADLKVSLVRMAQEGKRAIDDLRAEISTYQTKLEEAEELASRDALTGLRNRSWTEDQMQRLIDRGSALSVAIVDIDHFKAVNDEHGHLVGDELLRQFAKELRHASRGADLIGRWGGDEFLLVLEDALADAEAQIQRLSAWVCGSYSIPAEGGPITLRVEASIGLAGHQGGETMNQLLARADAAMYTRKAEARGSALTRR